MQQGLCANEVALTHFSITPSQVDVTGRTRICMAHLVSFVTGIMTVS
jgi:hypothetical protein